MAMRGFFIDNSAFEKYRRRIPARRFIRILQKLSDSTMFPDNPDYGDSLFHSETPAESEFWDIVRRDARAAAKRTMANRENGARGGRPPKQPEQPTSSIPPAQKAAGIQQMIGVMAHNMTNRTPYRRIMVDADFDLSTSADSIAQSLRTRFPAPTLRRMSVWLRQPDKFLGKFVDEHWLIEKGNTFSKPRSL